ncbi:Inositol-1-monophosphatase [Alphaproteobacteria bacterium]
MQNSSGTINIMSKACYKAAAATARDFNELWHLQVSKKSLHDFVSSADIKAEKSIINELKKFNPAYHFLVEESGYIAPTQILHPGDAKHSVQYCWVVDPIDGTSNFIRGNPHFAISIALEKFSYNESFIATPSAMHSLDDFIRSTCNNEIIAGVIYLPVKQELYWAEKGQGAYHIDVNNHQTRIRVALRSQIDNLLSATVMPSNPSPKYDKLFKNLQQHHTKFRISGSIAMDLAYLASGRYDMLFLDHMRRWDIAAGMVILQEAGGTIVALNEGKIQQNMIYNGIIAANEELVMKLSGDFSA